MKTNFSSPEAVTYWQRFVKPIFEVMRRRGIRELRITRTGDKVRFVLEPERTERRVGAPGLQERGGQ